MKLNTRHSLSEDFVGLEHSTVELFDSLDVLGGDHLTRPGRDQARAEKKQAEDKAHRLGVR
jgi:hypothetical protein